MKKGNIVLVVSILYLPYVLLNASPLRIKKILGTWQIKQRIYLVDLGLSTQEEKVSYDSNESVCLRSKVVVASNRITTIPKNACYFYGCDTIEYIEHKLMVTKGQDIYGDSVGNEFLRLIGISSQSKEIDIIRTTCKIDWGNDVLEIFFIDKKKIALYCGSYVLILTRD